MTAMDYRERVAIRLERVTKRYETVTALNELTFDVRSGEMFGLIGPDGAGHHP